MSREFDQDDGNIEKKNDLNIYSVPFLLSEIHGNINILTNKFKDEIIAKAFKAHSNGDILEAANHYERYLALGLNNSVVLSNYGIILKVLGKIKEAERYQRKSIELNPNFARGYYNLANTLKEIGNLTEAELFLRKAINLKIDFAEAYCNLATILYELGKLSDAEFFIRKSIQYNPCDGKAYSNRGIILRELGQLKEAESSHLKAIELTPDVADFYYNLANTLHDLRKLKEAESFYQKSIKLMPNFAEAYSNLGNVQKDLGYLNKSELAYLKALEIKNDLAGAYFSLSTLLPIGINTKWRNKLFSKVILDNKKPKETIDIYFARSNIFHKEKKYIDSAECLQIANQIKIKIKPFNPEIYFNKSKQLLTVSYKKNNNLIIRKDPFQCIFIVGMPRSGSTLLESILSINSAAFDLGETNILEEAFLYWNKVKSINKNINLSNLYLKKVNISIRKFNIITDKMLYNYQYAGIIANQIDNAKIIHCFRNPLDNILSIYRANFSNGNEFSSSLVDCANVYLDQEQVMTEYKNKFRSKIYDLNYDSLVTNSDIEIKSLISWLGWEWDESYLSPHLNPRAISTASTVQVRTPINPKSVGGWKNYKEMLHPALEILAKHDKYRDLSS
ncbi:tetratricopeptide repeat-containing sulfotransferase family protein [Prochlorococcus marinus]|uniref:tetratricopeptide repeat-containing sulfotransferase family protein n=1 Tax=Prochlorococcus marinus TaxID=1219 RepID=UPI0022B48CFD|nr:tetratricopeptide repeat-containing sulfotransferase family protein [Prochlorococcus marinus]